MQPGPGLCTASVSSWVAGRGVQGASGRMASETKQGRAVCPILLYLRTLPLTNRTPDHLVNSCSPAPVRWGLRGVQTTSGWLLADRYQEHGFSKMIFNLLFIIGWYFPTGFGTPGIP